MGYVAAAGLAGLAERSHSQPAARAPQRVGHLSFGSPPSGALPDPDLGFREYLRELGRVDGRDIAIESRYAEGRSDRLAALAAELVRMKVDVIYAGGPATTLAARTATDSIPIVTVSGADPVSDGWAQSLAHPGGNVTGMTVTFPELGAKRLELLKLAVPGLTRVALLWAPADLHGRGRFVDDLVADAARLGLHAQPFDVAGRDDLEAAFDAMRHDRIQGVYAVSTNVVVSFRARIGELAASRRIASVAEFSLLADAGVLMTYGANLDAIGRRAAVYVDRILRGAHPGDLPIERPTVFELVLNLRAAKALGITLPQALLVRADRVIE